MGLFQSFRSKKTKPIINAAVEEKNRNMNDLANWQGSTPTPTPKPTYQAMLKRMAAKKKK